MLDSLPISSRELIRIQPLSVWREALHFLAAPPLLTFASRQNPAAGHHAAPSPDLAPDDVHQHHRPHHSTMPSRALLRLGSQTSRLVALRSAAPSAVRAYSSSKDDVPPQETPKGPTQDVLPHVSEEAANTAKILGQTPPELEQGTPVEEVLKRDPEAQRTAPHVLKDTPGTKRNYSTAAADKKTVASQAILNALRPVPEGAKFPLPDLPLPSTAHLHRRYSPILDMVTNLIMKDGKVQGSDSQVQVQF